MGYQTRNGKVLHNPIAEVKLAERVSPAPFTTSTFLVSEIGELPPQGEICCSIPSLPLTEGEYTVVLVLLSNREIVDMVETAGRISVAGGDHFGTGRLPKKQLHGPFLVHSSWDVAAVSASE